jgi:DNA-binding FrmR family transcriptional regulator
MNNAKPKDEILTRLKRIEGQIRGLQKMVEKGDSCADIMVQVAAVTSAIKRVAAIIIHTYLEECLEKIPKEGGGQRKANLQELRKAISRYIDWS